MIKYEYWIIFMLFYKNWFRERGGVIMGIIVALCTLAWATETTELVNHLYLFSQKKVWRSFTTPEITSSRLYSEFIIL